MPTPDELEAIAQWELRVRALEHELTTLPQSAPTQEEGVARKRQAQQQLEMFRDALRIVQGSIKERERLSLREEEERKFQERSAARAQEVEERFLAQQRIRRQVASYTELLLRDAEAWKGRALTKSEAFQVRGVATARAAGGSFHTTDRFIRAWRQRPLPTFEEFTQAPTFIGPPVSAPTAPVPAPAAPPTTPPVTDFVLDERQRLRLRQELVDLTESEANPERITDAIVDQVIASLRAVAVQEGALPLAGREMTVFLASILGDIDLTPAQEETALRYSQALLEPPTVQKLLLQAPPFNLDNQREVVDAIRKQLAKRLREQGAWDEGLPAGQTLQYLEDAASDIYNQAVFSLVGTGMEEDTGAFWAAALQGILAKVQGVAEVGGLNRSLVAPPDIQRQVRQYIASRGLTPQETPSREWLSQMEPIAAEVEHRLRQEQARLDAAGAGEKADAGALVKDVVDARLMSEGQIIQEQEERRLAGVDLRTRFDVVSERPSPLEGEKPQDIDVLLDRAFERSERRFRLAEALGEKPDFEVIASEEVLRAQEHLAEVAPGAAAFFGPQPPGMGFLSFSQPLAADDAAALQAFSEATGQMPVQGAGGFLSLTAGRAILRQRRREEAITAERQRRQEMVAEEEALRREEGFAPFTPEEIASFLAGAVEAAPAEEPLTREQVLETPTGQQFFQATSIRFAREVAQRAEELQRVQQEEERRLAAEERRVAAEERERKRREREAQPRGLGTSVR